MKSKLEKVKKSWTIAVLVFKSLKYFIKIKGQCRSNQVP